MDIKYGYSQQLIKSWRLYLFPLHSFYLNVLESNGLYYMHQWLTRAGLTGTHRLMSRPYIYIYIYMNTFSAAKTIHGQFDVITKSQ